MTYFFGGWGGVGIGIVTEALCVFLNYESTVIDITTKAS